MVKNIQNEAPKSSEENLSLFGAGLIPFVLSNIGNSKLTKSVSRGLAIGICGKFIWNFIKSKRNNDKYTSINIHEGSNWFDYVIRWLGKVKVDYQGSEFEFIDLDNLQNNNKDSYVLLAPTNTKVEEKTRSFDFMPSSNCKVMVDGIEVVVILERVHRDNNNARWAKDKFIVKIKSKKEQDLRKVFSQIEQLGNVKTEYPKSNIYTFTWDWKRTKQIFKYRNVVLPNREFEKLKDLIGDFLSSHDKFSERGVPWRLGILLSGMAGAGKSTTVEAIATHFNLDVYIIQLSEMSDSKLMEAINRLPERCILLLEDVRGNTLQAKQEDGSVLSSSGLLNALDGIAIPEGRICFMTTNFKEELDPVLVRPGRIDYEIKYTYANQEQILDLSRKFDYNISSVVVEEWANEKICMAEVQNRLLQLTKHVKIN